MKRRTALAVLTALPAVAAKKQTNWSNPRKLATNSIPYYEAQFLTLFLALLSMNNGAANLDVFLASGGKRPITGYFQYTTDQAFQQAYNLLVTQKMYPSVIAFQDDFRKMSKQVVAQLSGQAPDGIYPKVCPTDENLGALVKSI
jgi:hypothetical protein